MNRYLAAAPLLALCLASLNAQSSGPSGVAEGGFTDADIPRDLIEGNYVLQEVDHVRPILVKGPIAATFNRPTGELVFFTLDPFRKIAAAPLGLGPNSLVEHPTRPWEFWITDSVSNCVSVWSAVSLAVVRTIRTAGGPHGIVFDDDGSHAYVACSSGRSIDVIDAESFAVLQSIPLELRDPRVILRTGSTLWVAPLASGNDTVALGAQNENVVTRVSDLESAGANPLPDEDLLGFAIGADGLLSTTPPEVRRGLGTTLLNGAVRPGSDEIWIAGTEALNLIRGEESFVGGRVVENRLAIIDVSSDGPPQLIDLDALTGAAVGSAMPRALAFDAPRGRVYVACEGSDAILALDESGALLGHWRIASREGVRAMPQGLARAGDRLLVLCYGTNTLVMIDLATTPFGTTVAGHVSLGYDPAPLVVRRGRSILNDADVSPSKTSSCASCHVSGHTTQTIYDLGTHVHGPEVPPEEIEAWLDEKGPMVTQSLRGLPETAPYHWRGERRDLEAFNGAFEGLLGGEQLAPEELEALNAYIARLVHPANPAQQLDRVTTASELEGARIFVEELATGGQTCNACHTLPLGTNGETMQEFLNGQAQSLVVAQLRAVAEKEVGEHDLGTAGPFNLGKSSRIGPALLHHGRRATLFDFNEAFVNIDPVEAQHLTDFLRAYDTGLPPSTAFQSTVHQGNASGFQDLAFLIAQAEAGQCDLVAQGSVDLGSAVVQARYAYWPEGEVFVPQSSSWPWLTGEVFIALAEQGYGPWTFVGTPAGMGFRKGIDLDLDGVVDLDEGPLGTDPANADSDGDGLPDGHEIRWGTDPLVADAHSPDQDAPGIDSVEVLWVNSNTARVRVLTDEPCRVLATWQGTRGPESRVSPDFGPWDVRHSFVVNFLPAGASTSLSFEAFDPAGNASTATAAVATDPETLPNDMFVEAVNLALGPIAASTGPLPQALATVTATVEIGVTPDFPGGPGVTVHAFVYLDDGSGQIQVIATDLTATTDAAGVATLTATLGFDPSGPSSRTVWVGVHDLDPPDGGPFLGYVEALDLQSWSALAF